MTIVSLAVLVSMNVQLAQSLKVISILSTLTLVQNVVLALTLVHQKLSAWANKLQSLRKYDGGCPLMDGRFFLYVCSMLFTQVKSHLRLGEMHS